MYGSAARSSPILLLCSPPFSSPLFLLLYSPLHSLAKWPCSPQLKHPSPAAPRLPFLRSGPPPPWLCWTRMLGHSLLMCPSPPHLKHALFCLFFCAPEIWGPSGFPQISTWLPCGSGGLPKPLLPGMLGHSLDRWPTPLHRKQFMSLTPAMTPTPFVLPPAQPFIASWDLECPTGFSSTCCAHLAPNPLPLPGAKPPLPLPREGLASQCGKVVAG